MGGGSNLILGTGRKNQTIIFKTCIIFEKKIRKNICQKKTCWEKKFCQKKFFPCGGGSNLILGTGSENQIFFLRTPVALKFFHHCQKMTLWCKKENHYPPRWICITHIWSPQYSLGEF